MTAPSVTSSISILFQLQPVTEIRTSVTKLIYQIETAFIHLLRTQIWPQYNFFRHHLIDTTLMVIQRTKLVIMKGNTGQYSKREATVSFPTSLVRRSER
jgi:hypothetical protein